MDTPMIDRYSRNVVEEASRIVGYPLDDKCWPLFRVATDNLQSASTNLWLQQCPPIGKAFQCIGQDYTPLLFAREFDRQNFISKTNIYLYSALADRFFPTRQRLTEDRTSDLVYCSAEMHLGVVDHFSGTREHRYIMLLRDDFAPSYKGCLTSPGGMMDRTPITTIFKEANEEVTLIVKQNKGFHFLHLMQNGIQGLSEKEKRERLPLALERLRQEFPITLHNVSADQVKTLPAEMIDNPALKDRTKRIRIDYEGDLRYEGQHLVVRDRGMKSVSLQSALLLPPEANGISLRDLVWGKNFFAVDTESAAFSRSVYLLNKNELAYARHPETVLRDFTPPLRTADGLPVVGGVINIVKSLTDHPAFATARPAQYLRRVTEKGTIHHQFVPSSQRKNGGRTGGSVYSLLPRLEGSLAVNTL
ncbi:MAG: hypothetical protein EOM37_08725 [Proteobacteria bacterium]|jgi:hypothetical protein|nr:hypothetical protein [Alphaproteobacteria bacterium]NCC04111.1 hypothetical protein [Pseudomonadota bacterium]